MERATENTSSVGAGSEQPAGRNPDAHVAHPVPTKPTFFNFDAQAVRVVGDADAPWFVAKDVCAVLELEKTDSALRGLEDDEKGAHIVSTLGGPQQLSVVNESGLYALIFRSRKAQARVFRRWVTSEVLPSLRRTGAYGVSPGAPNDIAQLAMEMRELVAVLRSQVKPERPNRLRGFYVRESTRPENVIAVLQDGPMTADAAMDALANRFGHVSRSTFYCRLAELVGLGQVTMHTGCRYSAKKEVAS